MLDPKIPGQILAVTKETGELHWKSRPIEMFGGNYRAFCSWNKRFTGKEAFTAKNNHGYRVGSLFGKIYTAHRVIWAVMHGEWPEGPIDHVNGARDDNRISNLRVVSASGNQKNQKMPTTNTSGVVGVCLEKRTGNWVASIHDAGTRYYLGTFKSIAKAAEVRAAAELRLGYHTNHGTSERG